MLREKRASKTKSGSFNQTLIWRMQQHRCHGDILKTRDIGGGFSLISLTFKKVDIFTWASAHPWHYRSSLLL